MIEFYGRARGIDVFAEWKSIPAAAPVYLEMWTFFREIEVVISFFFSQGGQARLT